MPHPNHRDPAASARSPSRSRCGSATTPAELPDRAAAAAVRPPGVHRLARRERRRRSLAAHDRDAA